MCEIKRIKDYLSLSGVGFFKRIENKLAAQTSPASPPWADYISSAELDSLYYLNYKRKIASDWWEDMEGDTDAGKDAMASMLWGIYKVKWSHLFKIFQAEYDPLENYDRYENTTETTIRDGTEKTEHSGQDETVRTPDITRELTRSGTDTDTRTPDLTNSSETKSNIADSTNKRAAFNSSEMIDTDGSHSTQTDNREDKETGTETTTHTKDTTDTEGESGTETTTFTKGTEDTLTRDTKDTLTRVGRIHGNIGVTTAAQMMTGDKEAWDSLKLIEGMLMDDINEQLTLPIY